MRALGEAYGVALAGAPTRRAEAVAAPAASRSTRRGTRSSSRSRARATAARRGRSRPSGGSPPGRSACGWACNGRAACSTRDGYVGLDVHRAARIAAAGHGGQIVLSEQTQKLLGERDDLRDLGRHRLKDMGAAERIFQLGGGDFARLKSLNQTNLPIQATPFLGREEGRLGDLVSLMRRDDVRLVTLIGPGGAGKTRLSLQGAAELVEDHPDGGGVVRQPRRRERGHAAGAGDRAGARTARLRR